MPSLPLQQIVGPHRQHRPLLTAVPGSPGHYELEIDNTSLEKMLTCPRSYELYKVLGRDSGDRDATGYGSGIHKALEVYYWDQFRRGLEVDHPAKGPLDSMVAALREHFETTPPAENSWRTLDHAIEAMERYVAKYDQVIPAPIVEHNGKPMIEVPFRHELFKRSFEPYGLLNYPPELLFLRSNEHVPEAVPLKSLTVYWTGRIDLVRRVSSGRARPMDHKTTSMGGGGFWKAFHLSSQMMGYCWATQQTLGEEIDGVDVNMIGGRKPTEKGKGTPHEFEWQPFYYTQGQLADWKRDTIAHVNLLIDRLVQGYFPKATAWCQGKYGECPYFPVCSQSDHNVQATVLMSGMFKDTSWSPLNERQ